MKNILFSFMAAVLFMLPVSALTEEISGSIVNEHPGVGHIAVVGDSLAAGFKATDSKVKPAGCLSQNFDHDKIINIAIPGLTSEQILKAARKILKYNSKLVFISSGGNDTLQDDKKPGSYPKQKTLDEMNLMFDAFLKTGAVVAYLGLNPPAPYPIRLPEITQMALNKGVIVVDGMNGLWENPQLMSDHVHPNNAGYAIMCSRIVSSIQSYYP
ncbi:MAG: SGNH/GDSL hydrolase family protein [Moraxellaceae bacterium]|nr:SGNH/GDSL hydrolase family protein [Pseudobdellovibrionaceae bacterium]